MMHQLVSYSWSLVTDDSGAVVSGVPFIFTQQETGISVFFSTQPCLFGTLIAQRSEVLGPWVPSANRSVSWLAGWLAGWLDAAVLRDSGARIQSSVNSSLKYIALVVSDGF